MLCCFRRKVTQDEELGADNDCRWKTRESNHRGGSGGDNHGYITTNDDDDGTDPYGLVPPPLFYLDSGESTDTDVAAAPPYGTSHSGLGPNPNNNRKRGSRKYHYEHDITSLSAQKRAAKLDPNSELQRKSKLHNEKLPSFSALDRTRKPRTTRVVENSGLHGVEDRGGPEEAVSPGVNGKYVADDGVGLLVHKPLTFDTFLGSDGKRTAKGGNSKSENGNSCDPRVPPLAVIAPLSTNSTEPHSSFSCSVCQRVDGKDVSFSSPSGESYFDAKREPGQCLDDVHETVRRLSDHQVTTKTLATAQSFSSSPMVCRCDDVSAQDNNKNEKKSLPLLSFLHKATKDEYRKFIHGSSIPEDKGRVNEGFSSVGDTDGKIQTSRNRPSFSARKESHPFSDQEQSDVKVNRKQTKASKADQPGSKCVSSAPKVNVTHPSTDSLPSQAALPGQPATSSMTVCGGDLHRGHHQHLLQIPELIELTKLRVVPSSSQWQENGKYSSDSNMSTSESPKVKKTPPKKPKRKNRPLNANTAESRNAIASCLTDVTSKEAQSAVSSVEKVRPNDAESSDVNMERCKLGNLLLAPPPCFTDQVYAGFDSFDEVNGSLV